MAAERFYIYRCGATDSCALTAVKNEPRLRAQPSAPWQFWMQVTRNQVEDASIGFGFDVAIKKIQSDGFFVFTGTVKLSRTAYLFQCEGEDLYAVSYDASGANIPRSPCTQGWTLCEKFELGQHNPVPAPILAEPILRGIESNGFYVWRGWGGPSKRPA